MAQRDVRRLMLHVTLIQTALLVASVVFVCECVKSYREIREALEEA